MASTLTVSELARLERSLYDAMIADDFAALEKLLSEDLRYIHSKGLMQTKADYLKAQRDQYNYAKIESADSIVHNYPGFSVMTTIVHMSVSIGAKPESLTRMLISYVWKEESQGWRLVLRQSAHLAPAS